MKPNPTTIQIAVVIPAYRVCGQIIRVLESIGPEVNNIYVIDDCCPDNSGEFVRANIMQSRIKIIRHEKNQGVGGAVMTGYLAAVEDNMDIIIKVDGDGQMDPRLIPNFTQPIITGTADYTKGNRFYNIDDVRSMPLIRLLGNAALSFITKLSSGYWNIFDPTNGYTAIHCKTIRKLPLSKISKRYFFESDLLCQLNLIKAVVMDIPMQAVYKEETSNLKIKKIFLEFFVKHLRNFIKRIFYNYYLRDMSLASIELPLGLILVLYGTGTGISNWIISVTTGHPATPGTVMLAALPVIVGLQFILAFFAYDIASVPRKPISTISKIV